MTQEPIKQIKLPLPSISEQSNIATILLSVDRKIRAGIDKRSMLKSVRKGLMQKLLIGKIRVRA